jgi:hypothetical protein
MTCRDPSLRLIGYRKWRLSDRELVSGEDQSSQLGYPQRSALTRQPLSVLVVANSLLVRSAIGGSNKQCRVGGRMDPSPSN